MSVCKSNTAINFQYSIMQRYAAVLSIVCILLCLSYNNTFPLHRGQSDFHNQLFQNSSRASGQCNIPSHHQDFVERTKHMASNIESAFKKFKDSTHDFGRNIYNQVNSGIRGFHDTNSPSEDEVRLYEQMVIMKKYPYLDLKELEQKFYSAPHKNIRQSVKIETGRSGQDSSIYEPSIEESPNVEITNRGLSGFAIPPQLSKQVNMDENKLKFNNLNEQEHLAIIAKKSSEQKNNVGSLKNDVLNFVDRKIKIAIIG